MQNASKNFDEDFCKILDILNETDFSTTYSILVCLQLTRKFIAINELSEQKLMSILEETCFLETLDFILSQRVQDKILVELEALWLIQDLTYMCDTNKAIDALMERILDPHS